jgi:hypothetical protein
MLQDSNEIYFYYNLVHFEGGVRGSVVVKAVCYKPEGCVAQGPGVYSASNRNEYQKEENNVSGD